MPGRTNAASELTRFWLQARHGCLVDESIAVPIKLAKGGGNSDIDLIAVRADLQPFALPDGIHVGPRLIVETKDEHDFDPKGLSFGNALRSDVALLNEQGIVPSGTTGIKFTMLRQEHYEKAQEFFGTSDFDRLFVVHALDATTRAALAPTLTSHRIYWLTIPEMLADLMGWYEAHGHPTVLRQSLVGDLLHLLVGFCRLQVLPPTSARQPVSQETR